MRLEAFIAIVLTLIMTTVTLCMLTNLWMETRSALIGSGNYDKLPQALQPIFLITIRFIDSLFLALIITILILMIFTIFVVLSEKGSYSSRLGIG